MDPIIGAILALIGFTLLIILGLCYFIYSCIKKQLLTMKMRKAFFQTDERYDRSWFFRLSVNTRIYAPSIVAVIVVVVVVAAISSDHLPHNPFRKSSEPSGGESYASYGTTSSYSSETSAVQTLRQQASAGSAEANNELGVRYYNGDGVPQSYDHALNCLYTAANLGDVNAMNNLGRMYRDGFGTLGANVKEALVWFGKAANRGDVDAFCAIGEIYSKYGDVYDLDKALYWYRKAAANGSAEAQQMVVRLASEERKDEVTEKDELEQNSEGSPKNSEDVDNAIRNYYLAVQEKRIDDALSMYTERKRGTINEGRLRKTAAETVSYRIEQILHVDEAENSAKCKVLLWHKLVRGKDEFWEVEVALLKEHGEWKIESTPGKRVKSAT